MSLLEVYFASSNDSVAIHFAGSLPYNKEKQFLLLKSHFMLLPIFIFDELIRYIICIGRELVYNKRKKPKFYLKEILVMFRNILHFH